MTEFYNTQDIAEATVELGDASYLSKKINPETDTHSFEKPEKDVSVFYHRDRGEDWRYTQPRISESEEAFLSLCRNSWVEYAYLFKDGEWHYYDI